MSRTSTASANFPDYQLAEATYPNLVGHTHRQLLFVPYQRPEPESLWRSL